MFNLYLFGHSTQFGRKDTQKKSHVQARAHFFSNKVLFCKKKA